MNRNSFNGPKRPSEQINDTAIRLGFAAGIFFVCIAVLLAGTVIDPHTVGGMR